MIFLFLSFLLLFFLLFLWTPKIQTIRIDRNGHRYPTQNLPIEWYVPNNTHATGSVTITLRYSPSQSTVFNIRADDCIDSFKVNGIPIAQKECTYGQRKDYALKPYLIAGTNTIMLQIHNIIGDRMGVDFIVSQSGDTFAMFTRALLILLLLWTGVVLFHKYISQDLWLLGIFLSSFIVRVAYVGKTWFDSRSHDVWSHLDYIRFLASQWSLPPGTGWEFHQAPLYYAVSALFLRLARNAGWSDTNAFLFIQQGSFVLSISTVLLSLWIGTLLFLGKKQRTALLVYSMLIATLPGLAMFSSRITNDVLISPMLVLTLGCFIRYWKIGSVRWWYATCFALAIGFLTKLSALVLLPVIMIGLISRRHVHPKINRRHLLASCFLVLALTSPLIIGRLLQTERDLKNIVWMGKSHGINEALKLDHDPKRFLVFNPVEIMRHPFNTPWGDNDRRRYYPEYLFKSAFFGEFSAGYYRFNALGIYIVMCALLLVPWGLCGFAEDITQRRFTSFPLWCSTVAVLYASLLYAMIFADAPEQDFRFSPLLGLLGAYCVAKGIDGRKKFLQRTGCLIALILSVLSCIFLFGA